MNPERLRDKSDKLHRLHASIYSIRVASCADQFSRVKICFDTFYYLRDRKVPDHLDGGQDRFTSRLESGEPDHHCRRCLRLHRRLVVLVKGFGEEKGGGRKGEGERERARSTGWCESHSYRQRYKCPAEAALMKQMHTRYMQLGRAEI